MPLGKTAQGNQPATLAVRDIDGQSSGFAGLAPKRQGAPMSGWQNKETVHSDNMYSYNISGVAGQGLDRQPAGGQEMLSLGSGRMLGGQSMASGLDGERKSMAYAAGGVFSGTLQSFQQPRSIMTAQGGARATNRAYGASRGRQGAQAMGEKKILASQ